MKQVIQPPNRLAEAAVKDRGPNLATILQRVNAGIDKLQQDYEEELQAELRALGVAADLLAEAERGEAKRLLGELFDLAHEIRGLAGSFGYPLLSKIANALCTVIERQSAFNSAIIEVVLHHVGAMRAVAAGSVKGDGGRQGAELLASLQALTEKAAAQPDPGA